IDAVQISGPTGTQWAASANASSEKPPTTASPGAPNPETFQMLRAEAPVSEWSDNWLSYSPFDCIVLAAGDVATLPPAIRDAIGRYLWGGGELVVAGSSELPTTWHSKTVNNIANGMRFDAGFGDCFALDRENLAEISDSTLTMIRKQTRDNLR